MLGFVAGLAVALVVRWRWRSSVGLLVWLLAFGVTAADDVREVVTAPKWLAGLLRVSPFVVFGMLPFAAGRRSEPEGHDRWLPAVVLATVVAYLALAFAGVDTSGGKSLGPRLLLPLLPLLAVSAVMVIASYLRIASRVDRSVGWVGVAFVAMAVVIHLGGTIPAYRQRNADDATAIRAAASSPERIVVADDPFTAQLLFPLYDRKIIMLADSQDGGSRLAARLTAERVGGALSGLPQPGTARHPGAAAARTNRHARPDGDSAVDPVGQADETTACKARRQKATRGAAGFRLINEGPNASRRRRTSPRTARRSTTTTSSRLRGGRRAARHRGEVDSRGQRQPARQLRPGRSRARCGSTTSTSARTATAATRDHEPTRRRKLLLHRQEIRKLIGKTVERA